MTPCPYIELASCIVLILSDALQGKNRYGTQRKYEQEARQDAIRMHNRFHPDRPLLLGVDSAQTTPRQALHEAQGFITVWSMKAEMSQQSPVHSGLAGCYSASHSQPKHEDKPTIRLGD